MFIRRSPLPATPRRVTSAIAAAASWQLIELPPPPLYMLHAPIALPIEPETSSA